ncbi:MAG: 3-oxoacyl-[acyl-carrier-protein] reductase [Candidatus Omnitrophica bacterium]|nr:3-oxoacyl-[acyl-carrier-protein] reductase [Candidatus Omnitrophota bacterium]MDD5487922.1 3-oxoacyl-[acyl-carrier-protein] reductase [Candidatus Omnitrophota bacterium]
MLLKDKVAIITGGSRGIGEAIVRAFAAEGAAVAFNYLKSRDKADKICRDINADGGNALAIKADVKDFKAMKDMVDETKKVFGRLDVVVNNAGILRDKAMMLMEEEDWQDVISTNLSGTFNLTRAAIVTFLKQKSGNVINITSVAGLAGIARQVNYSSSKAGQIGLTKSLAREVGPYNIRVNAIAPGYTATDMTASFDDTMKEKLIQTIPLGRFGSVEDIAKLALFLASNDSAYITGQVFSVDGGLYM